MAIYGKTWSVSDHNLTVEELTEGLSAVYRMDPVSGKGTYLGTLQNYYADNMVITHEEKENEPNTFYVVGKGIDADGNNKDFLAESFILEPFKTTVLNDKEPADCQGISPF